MPRFIWAFKRDMSDNKKILVGKIVAPQGIRGEVRVQTYTQIPSDLKTLKVHGDKLTDGSFHFVRALPSSSVIIARIDGVNDRNAAELLRNTELFINRADLPKLKDGEYYQCDLIGMRVIRDGITIGFVDNIQNYGGGDILELDNGSMVSFAGAKVDITNKVISL